MYLDFFTEMFIVEFDWLLGRQKGLIFIKMLKNFLHRNHKGDEAKTWHTFLRTLAST